MPTALKQESNLAAAPLAWSETEVAEFLNREVLPSAWPGHEVAAVKKEHDYWKPGGDCAAVYTLRMDNAADSQPLRAVLTHVLEESDCAHEYGPKHGHALTPTPDGDPTGHFVPEHRCLVEFFPYDRMLPSLERATSPEGVRPFLVAALTDGSDPDRWRCEVKVLHYRPHNRCVVLYGLRDRDSDGGHEAIGKVFRKTTKSARVFGKHSQLYSAAARHGITIPRPLAFIEELGLVLTDRLHGVSIRQRLLDGADRNEMARAAATAMARLHELPFEDRKTRSWHTEAKRVRERIVALHPFAAELARRAEAALAHLERLASRYEGASTRFIHGDATLDHILLNDGSVGILDFDRAGLGDPALDVAYLMARIRKEARISGKQWSDELCDLFLSAYVEIARPIAGFHGRTRVLEALALVEKAVRSFRPEASPCENSAQLQLSISLLTEAETCIAGL